MPKKGNKVKLPAQAEAAEPAMAAQDPVPPKREREENPASLAKAKKKKVKLEDAQPSLEQQHEDLKLQLQALQAQLRPHRQSESDEQLVSGLKHLLKDNEISVPNFDASQSMSLQDWLTLVELMGTGTPDGKRINTVMKKLKDQSVLQRVINAREVPTSWTSFKQLLLGDQEDLLDSAINDWDSVNQAGRSVDQYLTHFQGALSRYQRVESSFQPGEQQLISKFRKGLQPTLRTAVAATSCATVLDVVKAAKRVEADQMQNQQGLALNSIQDNIAPAQREFLFRPEADQLAMQDEAKRTSMDVLMVFQTISQRGGKCYECGEMGHWRGDNACRRRQQGSDHHATPCPRHPNQSHSALECRQTCERHPNASHTKHMCTASPECFQFRSGNCQYGDRCKFQHGHEGNQSGRNRDQQQRGRGRGRDRDQNRQRRERSPPRQLRRADFEVTLGGRQDRMEKHPERRARDSSGSTSVFGQRG